MGSIEHSDQVVKLPIIDISDESPEVGKQMVDAAIRFGFLYVSTNGTGFTEDVVNRQFALSQAFFSSSLAEREACIIGTDNHGWTGMRNEILDPKHQKRGDFKEAFNLGEFHDGRPQQAIPAVFEDKLSDLTEFENACKDTSAKILDLLALGLKVEEPRFFSSRHSQPSGSVVRMLKYPAVPENSDYDSEIDIRAGAHSDYGSLALLFQRPGQPGLEIRTPDDTWAPVAVIPDGYHSATHPPILVNIGDLMSYWTNGLLKSTVHRVIFPKDNSNKDRYSIVYFCHPQHNTELIPVPSEAVRKSKLDSGTEVGYGGGATNERAMTAKEHLMNRLQATYGHRVERTKA